MERNLYIVNGRPCSPIRTCRKMIGPGVSFTTSAANANIGAKKSRRVSDPITSQERLAARE